MTKHDIFFRYKDITLFNQVFESGELIQIDTEKNLDKILEVDQLSIKNIVIVGAWRGNEVASFLRFKDATIYCFEPNEFNFKHLKDRWKGNERVICFQAACASFDGESELNEASLTGNDSLLQISSNSATGLKLVKVHKIKTVKLDSVKELQGKKIDLLWADTQGYEREVLSGATELLKQTKALFLEVYKTNLDYVGGVAQDELTSFLKERNFYLTAEGIDKKNIGGNALYLKNDTKTRAFQHDVYERRIKNSLKDVAMRKKLLKSRVIQKLVTFMPIRAKTLIKRVVFKLSR